MKSDLIHVRVSADTKQALREFSKREKITMSKAIELMVQNATNSNHFTLPSQSDVMGHIINFSMNSPKLRDIAMWIIGNQQYMKAKQHLLSQEVKNDWLNFMKSLIDLHAKLLGEEITAEKGLAKQKAEN